MIKRQGFVSNSSSSSFIIAYDKKVFGDMEKAFEDEKFGGYGNAIMDVIEDVDKFLDKTTDDDRWCDIVEYMKENDMIDDARKAFKRAQSEGKTLAYVNTDVGIDQGLQILWANINRANGNNVYSFMIGKEE